jgi:aryl-alcohol dehydrogenase-like predicted oxidoreductase
MKKKKLGNTGLEITRIGLGTWAIGGTGWVYAWGPQDDSASTRAIHKALELGVNWIDTAAAYGLGHSEEVVGRAVAGRRDKVIIATKCGLVWDSGNPTPYGRLKAASVRRELEASLKRLGTDYIDLYQIHWPKPDEDVEEAWAEISRHVKSGKIRYAGVSNFCVSQLERVRKIHPVASLQPPYSMLKRGVEEEILPYCLKNGIGVVAYSPMQAGILSGRFTRQRAKNLPDDDWRKKSAAYTEPELSLNLRLVEKLAEFSNARGRSVGELAVAWVNRRPEVTAAIVGGRSPEQVQELAGAAGWDLTHEEIAFVETILSERAAQPLT